MSTTQVFELDDETSKRLKSLAELRNKSTQWVMREALRRYLAEEERYEREKAEDLVEYEDYLSSGKAIDNKVATAWVDELTGGKKPSRPKQK